jgi:hypothetical protein
MRGFSASANPQQEGTPAVTYRQLLIQYTVSSNLEVEVVSPASY